MASVIQFKDVELHYDAPSGFTFELYTNYPGNAMALRKSIAFPSSTGRRGESRGVDTIGVYPEGTLYKVKITSTGVVRLFEGKLRVRKLGVYFDGANSEFWETQEIALGI